MFNRYELKYIMRYAHAKRVMEHMGDYLVPDAYGDKYGNYILSSLYYDTDDFLFYWQKLEGLKHRRKLRIRLYETKEVPTPETIVYVEIKERVDKIIRKRRIKVPLKDAWKLCDDREEVVHEKRDRAAHDEILHMTHAYDLYPQVITSYHRKAFNGTEYDPGLRVTFDTNLRYRRADLDLTSKKLGRFMIDPDLVIMEIKANNSIPIWITQMVAHHDIQLKRISKYCTCLERAEEYGNTHIHLPN